jgi:RHS repeat-associated protein
MKAKLTGMLLTTALIVLPVSEVSAATFYFHTDHLGTPQVVTDQSQQVVWQGEYGPFGEVTASVEVVEQNLRFPGQYFDRETGLYYNYFRSYDPSVGRYTQSDPTGLPGGINSYAYVINNPIANMDPNGLQSASSFFKLQDGNQSSMSDNTCGVENDDCEQEILSCRRICELARFDGDMSSIWGGSYAQCMLGCVSWRCMDHLPSGF